jgi:hypothetical protein
LSCLKKFVKNHNNFNQQILIKLNKFLHFIITSSSKNTKKNNIYIYTHTHGKWIKNNSIIQYSSNPKIYKHNSSIYLRLRRLFNDSGSSVARSNPTHTPTWVVSSSATTLSRISLSPKVLNLVRQTFNHMDATMWTSLSSSILLR